MKVPFLPLPVSPWSPVGYQIVEVGNEKDPANPSTTNGKMPAWGQLPPSLVGYEVKQIAEEKASRLMRVFPAKDGSGAKSSTRIIELVVLAAPVLAGCSFMVVLMLVAMMMSLETGKANVPPRAMFDEKPVMAVEDEQPREVVLPADIADLPVRKVVENPKKGRELPKGPALLAKDDCQVCKTKGGGERETFGTSVQFVRSPTEAARTAAAEDKLTFLLHISGNFEDAKFT